MSGHKINAFFILDNCIGDVNMYFSKKKFKSGSTMNRNADVTLFKDLKIYICIRNALI